MVLSVAVKCSSATNHGMISWEATQREGSSSSRGGVEDTHEVDPQSKVDPLPRTMQLPTVFTFVALLASATSVKLLNHQPEWLKKPCKRKGPDLNGCIRDTFQNMFPYLAKGIPEVGIPRFEPLFIEKIGITKGHGAVTLAGNFNSLYAHGPSNATALYTVFDIENGRFDIGLYIPVIRTESQYDLKGNILLLPLVGVGDSKLILRNVSTEVFMRVSFPEVQGEEVMRVDHMRVEFRLATCRIHLDNLFNGNKVLGHTVNSFLNKNALEVVEELKENIGESLAYVFKKVMNDAFGRIPTRFWIPTD